MSPRPRVALLTNLIAPYRAPVYRALAEPFELGIYYDRESAHAYRPEWANSPLNLEAAQVKPCAGWSVRRRWAVAGQPGVFEERAFNVTPGFWRALCRFRPAAIITNEMGARTLIALLYGAWRRVPVWVWWGGTRHTERNCPRVKHWVRWVITRWVRHWISYGATSTEYLRDWGVPHDRILQIQNCVEESRYRDPVAPLWVLTPRPVLLHVGRLVGLKGVDRLLTAAAALQREGAEFSLLLVGSGPEQPALERQARDLGLRHVRFESARPPADMPAVYRSADCLVFPTLQDVWGLVINEALWSGLPVISSVYAGCAKELLPAEALFDPLDPAEFKAALRRAISGQIPPPDWGRLKTKDEVATLIVEDLHRVLDRQSTSTQRPT